MNYAHSAQSYWKHEQRREMLETLHAMNSTTDQFVAVVDSTSAPRGITLDDLARLPKEFFQFFEVTST